MQEQKCISSWTGAGSYCAALKWIAVVCTLNLMQSEVNVAATTWFGVGCWTFVECAPVWWKVQKRQLPAFSRHFYRIRIRLTKQQDNTTSNQIRIEIVDQQQSKLIMNDVNCKRPCLSVLCRWRCENWYFPFKWR